MRYLFTSQAKKVLHEFSSSSNPDEMLLAFDFDGTLSPIASTPEKALLPQKTNDLLAALLTKYHIAVISGRKSADVKDKLGFKPDYLIGNHGVEGLPSWRKQMEKLKDICEGWRNQIESNPEEIPLHSGVFLENKVYSLSLHYRKSSRKHLVRRKLLEITRYLNPVPRIVPGKSVLNLVPEGVPHKGIALLELMKMAGVQKAIYVGDDDTDEDIFRLNHPDILTIRVGPKRNSEANFYLKRQSELNKLLEELLSPAPLSLNLANIMRERAGAAAES